MKIYPLVCPRGSRRPIRVQSTSTIADWGVRMIRSFGSMPRKMGSRLSRKIRTFRNAAYSSANPQRLFGCARPTVPPERLRICCGLPFPSSSGSFKRVMNRAWSSALVQSPIRNPVSSRSTRSSCSALDTLIRLWLFTWVKTWSSGSSDEVG